MNYIPRGVRSLLNIPIHVLNRPIVKEAVKNIVSTLTFAFGLIEIYDTCQTLQSRTITSAVSRVHPQWMQAANKVDTLGAEISLLLSAGVSRPGVYIISSLVGSVFSTVQLNRVLGPNAIFAVNPWHPRHVVSIVAVAFGLLSLAQDSSTTTQTRLMVLFNTITSRPILHICNQLSRRIYTHSSSI